VALASAYVTPRFEFRIEEIQRLNTIAIEVVTEPDAAIISLTPGLDDDLFEHDGPADEAGNSCDDAFLRCSRCAVNCSGISDSRGLGRDRMAAATSVAARDRHRGKLPIALAGRPVTRQRLECRNLRSCKATRRKRSRGSPGRMRSLSASRHDG